jgi:hypothetical protein
MIGLWIMFLSTGQVPELLTEPYRIAAHILAEVVTAAVLLIASFGTATKKSWARGVFLFGLGALFYTVIASPGYHLQMGVLPIVAMFAVILILDFVFFAKVLRDESAL